MATEEQEIQAPLLGDQEIHPSPRVLSILPMPDLVLFPRMIMPLVLWDEPAQKLVHEALFQDKIFGVLASRGNKVEGYGPEDLYQIGTAAAILKMRKADDDSVRLLVQGLYRFRITEWKGFEPYFAAQIDPISEEYEPDLEVEALVSNVKGLFLKMMELSPTLPIELGTLVRELSDPRILADIAAGSLNISKTEKQELLETLEVKARSSSDARPCTSDHSCRLMASVVRPGNRPDSTPRRTAAMTRCRLLTATAISSGVGRRLGAAAPRYRLYRLDCSRAAVR